MKRDKINLHLLPTWLKYLISLSVIAVVVIAAWIVNGGRPAPNWMLHGLIPVLGWIYLGLVGYLIVYHVVRRWRK
ncbi:MAG TPA: hypothetical protein VKD91_19290 [Pyrinomonadaceae bacterium]|nr:hypothetical protein [Pyrinomonadaceae bacterium]